MLLLLKCRVYTGLGFHSEEYILDQIHKISRSLKCYPCPPAPRLAHRAWDQSGSLRRAPLRACRSQGRSNLFLIVRNCWLCSITVDLCRKPVIHTTLAFLFNTTPVLLLPLYFPHITPPSLLISQKHHVSCSLLFLTH